MEMNDLLNKKRGNIEPKKLEAKPVTILNLEIQTKTKENKDMKSPLIHFKCKHPDKEEPIKVSKVKLLRNDKVMVLACWVALDDEGDLQKGTTIVDIMNFLGCETLKDIEGKQIDTVMESENSQFLCLKAY